MSFNFHHIVFSLVVLTLQILVFNRLDVSGYINPYIYPAILLILPFNIRGWALLLLAFFLGLIIDLFTGTIGLHTFSCVALAGIRPSVIKALSLNKFEQGSSINIRAQGIFVVTLFLGVLLFIHHLFYFILESFTFTVLLHTLLRIFLSSAISLTLTIMLLLVFNNPSKK